MKINKDNVRKTLDWFKRHPDLWSNEHGICSRGRDVVALNDSSVSFEEFMAKAKATWLK